MQRLLARSLDAIAQTADLLATLAFIGFFVAVCAQVGYRYLGISIVFSEELARLLNLYAVFLGVVTASRLEAHIRIDVIDHFIGPRRWLDATLRIAYQLAAIAFLAVVAIGASMLVEANKDIPLATMAWLHNGHIYLAAAIGSSAMLIVACGRIVEIALEARAR